MSLPARDRIDEIFAQPALIVRAVRQGGRDAMLRHKQLGVPIAVWQDGKVVWIPPEEIVVPELEDDPE